MEGALRASVKQRKKSTSELEKVVKSANTLRTGCPRRGAMGGRAKGAGFLAGKGCVGEVCGERQHETLSNQIRQWHLNECCQRWKKSV